MKSLSWHSIMFVASMIICFTLHNVASAGLVVLQATQDTRVLSIYPNSPDGVDQFPDLLSVYNQAGNVQRSLIQFDIASLPGNQQILSATLTLTARRTYGGNSSHHPMNIHRVTKAWLETQASWNSAATGQPWSTPGGDFAASVAATINVDPLHHAPVQWDVTGLVQDWYSNVHVNHGMLLQSFQGNSLTFWSREASNFDFRPTLTVSYAAVPEPSALLLVGIVTLAANLRRLRR